MARRTPRIPQPTLPQPPELPESLLDPYRAVEEAVATLPDPLGDVLDLVTEEQLLGTLKGASSKDRTKILQHLRTPAVGQPSVTAARQALAALRRSDKPQRIALVCILTQPVLNGLRGPLLNWLHEGSEEGLTALEELTRDRTELLLAGLSQWTSTDLGIPLLHLVLRDHALSSWPPEAREAILAACRAFEHAHRSAAEAATTVEEAGPLAEVASARHDASSGGAQQAVAAGPAPADPMVVPGLDDAFTCEQQAEQLEGSFAAASQALNDAASLLSAGRPVPPAVLRPVLEVRQAIDTTHLAIMRSPIAPIDAPGRDRISLLGALKNLAAAASGAHRTREAVRRLVGAVGPDGHLGVAALRSAAAVLLAADVWTSGQQKEAAELAAVADLADAVAADDDDRAHALSGALRDELPAPVAPVLTLLLRGKVTVPTGHSSDGILEPSAALSGAQPPAPSQRAAATEPPAHTPPGQGPHVPSPVAASAPAAAPSHLAVLDEPRTSAIAPGADLRLTGPHRVDPAPVPSPAAARTQTSAPQLPVPANQPIRAEMAPAGSFASDSSGEISVLAGLIARGRLALAHHAARALNDEDTAFALRALALADAMRSDSGACARELRAAMADQLQRGMPSQVPAKMLLLAAAVRAGLLAGDPDSGELVLKITARLHDLPGTRAVCDGIGKASARGQLSGHATLAVLATRSDTADEFTVICDTARGLRAVPDLGHPRARQLAERWWAANGPVGALLGTVADDRRDLSDHMRRQLRDLTRPGALPALLDTADKELRSRSGKSHSVARSRKLQNAARSRILQHAGASLDVVQQWLVLIAQAHADGRPGAASPLSFLHDAVQPHCQDMATELRAMADATTDPLLSAAVRVGLASLQSTVQLLAGTSLTGTEPDTAAVLNGDLLRCPDLELNGDLTPQRPPGLDDITAADNADWVQAVRNSIGREDYGTARIALDALEQDDISPPSLAKDLRATLHTCRARSGSAVRALHAELVRDIDTATRMGRVPEPGRSLITARLEAARTALTGDSLGAVRHECSSIRRELETLGEQAGQELQDRATRELNEADAPPQLADDVRRLIADGDLATAEEYLLAVRAGHTPPRSQHTPLADFTAFFPAVPKALPDGITPQLIAAAEAGGQHGPLDFSHLSPGDRDTAVKALTAWHDTATHWAKVRTNTYVLRAALRMAGIEYERENDRDLRVASPLRRWVDLREVTLIGNVRLPAFGTQSDGRLRLLMTSENTDATKLIAWVQQDPSAIPVVIAYIGTLPPDQRRALAAACAERPGKPVLVLDAAALAYLAARGSGQFALTERILAPFSAINPYTPDANEAVPGEMFYGRSEELSVVTAQNGVSLLYGGRRLGKSALLRAAARRHALTKGHVALYLPLPSSFPSGTEEIWDQIATELTRAGIGPAPGKRDSNAFRRVRSSVTAWLDEDRTRRLLFLFDECDAFFDTEAEADKRFLQITRLRDLMSTTDRRFKPVWAGLHKVQRFAGLPNQPLAEAHFGTPLVIGPLSPGPAYRLLQEPAEVLGIRFTDDSLVHRLLAYCNYHPKLLQIAGEALVREAIARRTPDGPPWTIDNQGLEAVVGNPDLRRRIRDTVRLNLNLDPRYKIIALLVAHNAYTHGVDHSIATRDLRNLCAEWWPDSITHHTADEFRALLEEMTGLGILTEHDGWRLRSSNVLRLLGTPDAIEEELHNHDPNDIPTRLSTSHARRSLPGGRISPLTEQQIADLVKRHNAVRIVLGTDATCLSDVPAALADQQQRTPSQLAEPIRPTKPATYRSALQSGKPGPHRLIITDMRGFQAGAVYTALQDANALQPPSGVTRSVIALIDAGNREHLDVIARHDKEADVLISLQRATADGIRSWVSFNDTLAAFNDPDNLRHLQATTSGWPLLLNQAAELAAHKRSPADTCRTLHGQLTTSDGARGFLDAAALTTLTPALQAVLHALVELDGALHEDELVDLLGSTRHTDPAAALTNLRHLAALTDTPDGTCLEGLSAEAWRRHGPR